MILMLGGLLSSAAAADVQFTVKQFAIEGDNPLSAGLTARLLQPYLGQHSDLSPLEEAANTLQDAMVDRGFAFHQVIVPPQTLTGETVTLKVVTIPTGDITVAGNSHSSRENVLRSLPPLEKTGALNTHAIARALQFVNAHPAKQTAVFVKQNPESGHIDARVEVRESRPYQVFASIANTGNKETGRHRVSFGAQHTNLFDRDHMVTLSYSTAPESVDDVRQFGAYYQLPVYSLATRLSAFYIYSEIDQGQVATVFEVSGKGEFGGLQLDHTLTPVGPYNHSLHLGVQDRFFDNASTYLGQSLQGDVRSVPVTAGYAGEYNRAAGSGRFHVEVVQNIETGSENNDLAYAAVRPGATADWHAFRGTLGGALNLPGNLKLEARLGGQYTEQPLIPGEQYGIGGVRSVRGYEERETYGESGYKVNVELASPLLALNTQILMFVDAGRVTREPPHPADGEVDTLSGVGFGFRWFWKQYVYAALDIAQALQDGVTTEQGDFRAHYQLFVRF